MIVPLRGVGPAVYASPFSKMLFPFLAVAIDISLGAVKLEAASFV